MEKQKILFAVTFVLFLFSLVSVFSIENDIINADNYTENGFVIEAYKTKDIKLTKDDIDWVKAATKFYPKFKEEASLDEFHLKANKLISQVKCSPATQYYLACLSWKLNYSDILENNEITNANVDQIRDNNKFIGYWISFYGAITSFDPFLDLVYSSSTNGFFNQTEATDNGIKLNGTASSGDFKYLAYFNDMPKYWNITLGHNASDGNNISLETRTSNDYNTTDNSLALFLALNNETSLGESPTLFIDRAGSSNGTCGNASQSCSQWDNDPTECQNHEGCEWSDSCTGTPTYNCGQYTTEGECITYGGQLCYWDSGTCMNNPCITFDGDPSNCMYAGCTWSTYCLGTTAYSYCPSYTENGVVGGAYTFADDKEYITVNDTPALNPVNAITISLWVYIDAISSYDRLIEKIGEGNDDASYMLHLGDDSGWGIYWNLRTSVTGHQNDKGSIAVSEGKWNHIVAAYDNATSNKTLWINGVLDSNWTQQGTIDIRNNELILGYNTFITSESLHGKLDEIRIYNRSLSASEIQNLYELGSYHINWLEWQNEGVVTSGTAYTSYDYGRFMQFKAKFNTNDASPYLFNHAITKVDVPPANESQGRAAIELGIDDALESYVNYTDQQIYLRNKLNNQSLGRFDKVAASGNQRWLMNYITGTENYTNMFNITPAVYVLEMANLTTSEIENQVHGFIDDTED